MTVDFTKYDSDFLRGLDVHDLIPQQEPVVMVGKLVSASQSGAVTETTIAKDNFFADDGRFSAPGLLENMAQTHAVRLGFINKYILGKEMQVGFIGAIRNADVFALPSVGETIRTEAVIREEVFGVILSDVTITCGGRQIARAELKIAMKDN